MFNQLHYQIWVDHFLPFPLIFLILAMYFLEAPLTNLTCPLLFLTYLAPFLALWTFFNHGPLAPPLFLPPVPAPALPIFLLLMLCCKFKLLLLKYLKNTPPC